MNDPTSTAVETASSQNVRRGRAPRTLPRESGADLLRLTLRLTDEEARVLAQARAILLKLCAERSSAALSSPQLVREYLTTLLTSQEREYFAVVALDNRHRVVASEVLFAGTIDGARVHPREVVKCALRHNAAAVIFYHFVAGHVMGIMHP